MVEKVLTYIKNNKLFAIGVLGLFVLVFIESQGQKDLEIFTTASNDLWSGKNIYTERYHQWYHYYYDVAFALLITPLHYIPPYWANVTWSLIGMVLTFRIWKIIESYLPIHELGQQVKKWLPVVAFLFIFSLWDRNIRYTQLTIVILYLTLEGIYQIDHKKWILGSALLGLGITIKVMPLVIIPYLLYRRNFKSAMASTGFVFAFLFLPSLLIGHEYNLFLLQERWKIINPLNSEHVLDVSERSFHSLTSLFSTLFVENARNNFSLDLKRNIADVDLDTLKMIINVARLFFIGLTLWFLHSLPFKKVNPLQRLYELSYILLIVPLIFPHQQHYAFFFTWPAIVYLTFYVLKKYPQVKTNMSNVKKYGLLTFFILIFFLLNSHFILGAFRDIYDHYKTLTYGVLLLIPVLAIMRPEKLGLSESNKVIGKEVPQGS